MSTDLTDIAEPLGALLAPMVHSQQLPGELGAPRFAPLRAAWAASSNPGVQYVAEAAALASYDRDQAFGAWDAKLERALAQLTHVGAGDYNTLHGCVYTLGELLARDDFSARSLARVTEHGPALAQGILGHLGPTGHELMLRAIANEAYGAFLTGLARSAPTALGPLVDRLLPLIVERAAKYRKDTRHDFSPAMFSGVFAALALAPELAPEWEKQLVKLAGKKNVTPMALLALYRHGHADSVVRLQSRELLHELRAALDFGQASLDALYFAREAGREWLRQDLLDESKPMTWSGGSVALARALGVWDRAAFESWMRAVERGDAGARLLVKELGELNDEDHARLRGALDQWQVIALDRQHPRAVTEEQVLAFFTEVSNGSVFLTDAVREARRMRAHAETVAPKVEGDLRARLVLALAQEPAASTPDVVEAPNFAWAQRVRRLEREWHPARPDTPEVRAKAKRAARASAE